MFLSVDTDVLASNIGDILPQYKNGDYKVIAVFAPERVDLMPDVPTAKELGFGDIAMYSARGYALPKGVDPAVREILMDALKQAINDPEVVNKLKELGAQTHFVEGQEYHDFLLQNITNSKQIYGVQ
jgi:tripartite-type tricarboxylate transporter receptor subunit TctC